LLANDWNATHRPSADSDANALSEFAWTSVTVCEARLMYAHPGRSAAISAAATKVRSVLERIRRPSLELDASSLERLAAESIGEITYSELA
jgi:hypothetical protein